MLAFVLPDMNYAKRYVERDCHETISIKHAASYPQFMYELYDRFYALKACHSKGEMEYFSMSFNLYEHREGKGYAANEFHGNDPDFEERYNAFLKTLYKSIYYDCNLEIDVRYDIHTVLGNSISIMDFSAVLEAAGVDIGGKDADNICVKTFTRDFAYDMKFNVYGKCNGNVYDGEVDCRKLESIPDFHYIRAQSFELYFDYEDYDNNINMKTEKSDALKEWNRYIEDEINCYDMEIQDDYVEYDFYDFDMESGKELSDFVQHVKKMMEIFHCDDAADMNFEMGRKMQSDDGEEEFGFEEILNVRVECDGSIAVSLKSVQ